MKQIEKVIEPYRAYKIELSDIETLTKNLNSYHAAYFACVNLRLSLDRMQHFPSELQSAVTLPNQIFNINLLSKI